MTIRIDGYLLQSKLESAMKVIVGNDNWIGSETSVPDTRLKWDMQFKINGQVFVVEFDGDAHYMKALQIKNDMRKDEIALSLGYKTIRFPYWVQLTETTLEHYFGIKHKVEQNFLHGFIYKKAILPASYCELGINKFKNEIDSLPSDVKSSVVKSLRDNVEIHGKKFVLPSQLFYLLE